MGGGATMSARDDILGTIRRGLGRSEPGDAAVADRLAHPRRNLIPARAISLDPAGQRDLFAAMAGQAQATIDRVANAGAVPTAVARYLASENLPAEMVMAPDPALDAYPWAEAPLLTLRRGPATEADAVGITGVFAGIAETGTVMLLSGTDRPPSLHLLPDTHIAILRAEDLVAVYEDGWDRLRAAGPGLPRSVTFVTGPSRTGDIEQRIQLGAHGPRRLHIVLVGP